MENPLVSILIPFKNTAVFIPECIRSIRNQQYQNWEVIAVDDHSEDHSSLILKEFAEKDERIQVYLNTGTGIIAALRTAYTYAQGALISRMDSDDIMLPNRIQYMAKDLQVYGKGYLSIGQVQYFSDSGIKPGYARYEKWLNALTSQGNNFKEIYKECVIPSPCWMVHREDFNKIGAFESDRYPEDYDLAFRFYAGKLNCIPSDQVLHQWRDYSSRTSRTSVVYAQNYFLDIKVFYFLKLDHQSLRPLCVWGAGNKGKAIAQRLLKEGIPFYWVCDNPRKIGKEIYGKKMESYTFLPTLKKPQCIISVANEVEQKTIVTYLTALKLKAAEDYFFFC
ncbi:glycosyltransferase family 2 protein [Spongiimicrobium salis]|uniref:glycosyltransferase family 2 protein n=1 Tax=Spongiimicrobium salis TaxID=1667022 RepID=UPI00374D9D3D